MSTYRWLYRWWRQTGDVHASTAYIAKKQGISERTVYRRFAALRKLGLLEADVTPGVERRLRPVLPPPPKPRLSVVGRVQKSTTDSPTLSGVGVRGMSGVTPYRDSSDALTQKDATTPQEVYPADLAQNSTGPVEAHSSGAAEAADPELVKAVASVGVLTSVAQKLVQVYGEQAVKAQLLALNARSARDKAAVLVKSIREGWSIPAAVQEAAHTQRQDAQKAQQRALAAALEQKRQEQRQRLLERFHGLSEQQRAELLARASELAAKESPAAFSIIAGRTGFGPWITEKALKLLEGS